MRHRRCSTSSRCRTKRADLPISPRPCRQAVIERARAAGIGTMVTICTRLDEFPAVRAIAEAHDDIWCSIGVHPHEAADYGATTADELATLAVHPRVIGVGETGLDFHYD